MLSNNLREAREGCGLKKIEVAKKVNTTRSNLTRWEAGTIPRIESLIALAELYGVSLDYLVTGVDRVLAFKEGVNRLVDKHLNGE